MSAELARSARADAIEECAALIESWADGSVAQGEEDESILLFHAADALRALKSGEMVRCECTGCTVQVEGWARTLMCQECATENCDHEETEAAPPQVIDLMQSLREALKR